MLDTLHSPVETVAVSPQRYKRVVYWIFAVGIAGLFAGIAFDQPLAGTIIYLAGTWLGSGLAAVLPRVSEATLIDERDRAVHRRASGLAVNVTAVVVITVVPALYALSAAEIVTITQTMWGGIWAISAFFLLWGGCLFYVDRFQ